MNSDFDPEFVELIDAVGERRARALIAAAVEVAADIRADADELGTYPVDRARLRVLGLLPSITFEQSRFWRYQLAECADRLAQDTLRWGAPVPRCTGEEMVLHLIVGRAAAANTGLLATQAMVWSGNPADPDTWGDLSADFFQDHDVLTLYDVPAEAVTKLVGGVNLVPAEWFTEFTTPYRLPNRP